MKICIKQRFYLGVGEDWSCCKLNGCLRHPHAENQQPVWWHLPSGVVVARMWYGIVSSLGETHLHEVLTHILLLRLLSDVAMQLYHHTDFVDHAVLQKIWFKNKTLIVLTLCISTCWTFLQSHPPLEFSQMQRLNKWMRLVEVCWPEASQTLPEDDHSEVTSLLVSLCIYILKQNRNLFILWRVIKNHHTFV